MEPLPRPVRALSGWALFACAAVGLYLGGSRGFNEATTSYSGVTASSEGVASAKAIAPPPPPTFDEAAIRRIAKEEAQGVVAKGAPAAPRRRAAPSSDEQDYTTPSDAGIVYARPPASAGEGAASGAPGPAAPASAPPLQQF